ncbi:MAG: hypothetical protein JEZ03_02345, partial [Bacteroidales bacterium]|nr:hypothetical protein [Bacteroidales bacterium]
MKAIIISIILSLFTYSAFCNSEENGFSYTPDTVNFGDVSISGSGNLQIITISNYGDEEVIIYNMNLWDTAAVFSFSASITEENFPYTLNNNQIEIYTYFTGADTEGFYGGKIQIELDNQTIEIPLLANAIDLPGMPVLISPDNGDIVGNYPALQFEYSENTIELQIKIGTTSDLFILYSGVPIDQYTIESPLAQG